MEYKSLSQGEWVEFKPVLLQLACCDCGLVHNFSFEFRKGKIGFTIKADRRATAQIRKKRGIAILRGRKGER